MAAANNVLDNAAFNAINERMERILVTDQLQSAITIAIRDAW